MEKRKEWFAPLTKCCIDDETKDDKMGRECGTYVLNKQNWMGWADSSSSRQRQAAGYCDEHGNEIAGCVKCG
jgi:hypothetical protein